MAASLSGLFGRVADEAKDPAPAFPPPPRSPTPPGKSKGGSGSSPAPVPLPSSQGLTHLLYVTSAEASVRCMGMIGKSKFCVTSACVIQRHDISKFKPKPGLYIRVPRKIDHCFCLPFLPDEFFAPDIASEFLSVEKTVQEWTTIFASITATGTTITAKLWEEGQAQRKRVKAFTTPMKIQRPQSQASLKLGTISADLKDKKTQPRKE